MKKIDIKKTGNKPKILSTKKPALLTPEKSTPLRFRQISEAEHKACRNEAYLFLVK